MVSGFSTAEAVAKVVSRIRADQQGGSAMKKDDTGEAKRVVEPADSARQLIMSAEDDFPDVFSTSKMVALMETAAARAMRDELVEGQLSVGVGVRIRHLAATPIGAEVHARATFLGMQGTLYLFRVHAYDQAGLIGEGEHTRAVVTTDRLMDGALTRVNRSA
jgi:fluoroacetyl-CoA thioesterase